MNIDRDLLIDIGINIRLLDNNITCGKVPYQGFTAPMMCLNDYDFELLKIKMRPYSQDSFINAYLSEFCEPLPV